MKAISIQGPWWFYILLGVKPVENREWRSHYRGPLLIHAPFTINEAHRVEAMEMARRAGWTGGVPTPLELQQARGHIVGMVEMVDCVERHPSPFFTGRYGHVYERPQIFRTPVRCRGELNLFEVPDALLPAGIGRPIPANLERLDFRADAPAAQPARRTFFGVDLAAAEDLTAVATLPSDPLQRRMF